MKEVKRVYRVLRGGSWYGNPRNCRSAYRSRNYPDYRNDYRGFRVVCVPRTHQVKKGDKGDGK
jgi:formylglycine-generating enzyme required for sulfatase activity